MWKYVTRIGINALYLIPGGVGGTEIYLRSLLQALAAVDQQNEYIIFTNRETGRDIVPNQANFTAVQQPVRATFRPWRLLWEQSGLPLAVKRQRIDVLLNPGFTSPTICSCPTVTVFHDLQHKRCPQHFRWWELPFWKLFLWASVKSSNRIIAVSAATRDDLVRFYNIKAEIIHHGVEPKFFEIANQREPRGYILCVSTLHPHKNLRRLLQVHARTTGLPALVITGLKGFATKEIEKLAGRNVRTTGWIPREEVYELFRCADAFVYPSTFEGFGMPVLEAMAAGVPVACSDIPPLKEVAGPTVLYFNPADENEIQDAIQQLMHESGLVESARARAAGFTWEKSARETLRVLLAHTTI